MPGKIKVKVLAGRNLPVMDRASDTTDAFVEIKFGGVTHKTDVCRKSLNPHWNNTEWYRFEVDESELQDEPLQLRLMDHDTYSANDAIGKVVISLAPLLAREANNAKGTPGTTAGAVMSGWIPVFDTMHGIRGELNVIVKVELFSDFNKYKTSSCGVQFFHCPSIPPGYRTTSVHGFVEELVVNDDPEYQWIDKIRTPRASNEARQVAFIKLSNQVQRLVGLKAAELGANAVVGYQQEFDLEGEAGVVARAIGTAVSITPLPTPSQTMNIPPCTQQQLKKCLDILATDEETVDDLNEYYQTHQEELMKMIQILSPNAPSMLDETEAVDDDDDRVEQGRLSIHSFTGSMSLFQDDQIHHRSLKHLSEDQTDLNRLLSRKSCDDDDADDGSDSSGPIQKIKKMKTNFFSKRFSRRKRDKKDKQEDQISLNSNASDVSRISLVDIKNEFKKRFKKPKIRKAFTNPDNQGVEMASILARSVIHTHTNLACIAETQDSEHSAPEMRRTSESEPNTTVSDDDKEKEQKKLSNEKLENIKNEIEGITVPEIHFSSLKNMSSEEAVPERVRKTSESCPSSPMVGRAESLLKLPGDKGYFGSVSSALSGESSEAYSSSEEDDESSEAKSDSVSEKLETTSSVVNSVLNHEVNSAFIAQMEKKLSTLKSIHPLPNEAGTEDQIQEKEKNKEVDNLNVLKGAEVVEVNTEKSDASPERVEVIQPSTSAQGSDKCVSKPNMHHIKLHNPFAHKKSSKSFSAPSSPVEKKNSFVYRSSKRIKNQLAKLSNSSMIKSISHYSLLPKKKEETKNLSQPGSGPGSSSNVPSRAPSDTVLGSLFLSYSDLLSLDKEGLQANRGLCKSDELGRTKVSMYIGSEPVSRTSLSGPSFPSNYREEHGHRRLSSLKPEGLIHTAMETILIDKVDTLLLPTSPDPVSKNNKQFFDDVSEKLEEHKNRGSSAVINMGHVQSTTGSTTPRIVAMTPKRLSDDFSAHAHVVQDVKKHVPESTGLVHMAMETLLMDKAHTVVPQTPEAYPRGSSHDIHDKSKHKDHNILNSIKTTLKEHHVNLDSVFGKHHAKKETSPDVKTGGLVHTAMQTMLMERAQSMIPDTPEPIPIRTEPVFERGCRSRKASENSESSGLVHSAMQTILMDKFRAVIPNTTEPIPIHLDDHGSKPSKNNEKHSEETGASSGLINSAMQTILIDKVQTVLPDTKEPVPIHLEEITPEKKTEIENEESKGLTHSAIQTMLIEKVQTLWPVNPEPIPIHLDIPKSTDSSDTVPEVKESKGLTHSAIETMLIEKVQTVLPDTPEPVPIHLEVSKTSNNSDSVPEVEESKGLTHSAIQTMLIEKFQTVLPDTPDPILIHLERVKSSNCPDTVAEESKGLVQSAIETMLIEKVQSVLPDTTEPVPINIEDKTDIINKKSEGVLRSLISPVTKIEDGLIHDQKLPADSDENTNSKGLLRTAMTTMLIDKVQTIYPNSTDPDLISDLPIEDDKQISNNNNIIKESDEDSGLVKTAVIKPTGIEDLKSPALVESAMKTILMDKLQSADTTSNANVSESSTVFKDTESVDSQKTSKEDLKTKKLIRQDSIHSISEGKESKMSNDDLSNMPSKVTRPPVLQYFHPISGLETIPSMSESSFERSVDGESSFETNSASVCDNSHAACNFDRTERDRDRSEKDRGSPRHARAESYGGKDPTGSGQTQPQTSLNSTSTPMGIHRRSSDSDLSVTPKAGSLNTSAGNVGTGGGAILRPSMNSDNLDMLEHPFLTMTEYPPGFIVHIGGTVCARSVKLVDGGGESAARAAWWAELRTELRAHARALRCNAVVAYSDTCSICEDVCVLSASGTAAVINLDCDYSVDVDPPIIVSKDKPIDELDSCSIAHVPYSPGAGPYRAEVSTCAQCRRARVPAVLLATCAKPNKLMSYTRAVTLTAVAARVRRASPGAEPGARDISDQLPFLEYELHRLLLAKLRMQGANALFGLSTQVALGERCVVALASGVAVKLAALPDPAPPTLKASENDKEALELQRKLWDSFTANKIANGYDVAGVENVINGVLPEVEDPPALDLCADKDACVLELDEAEDVSTARALCVVRAHAPAYTPALRPAIAAPHAFAQVSRGRLTLSQSGGAWPAAERHVARALDGVAYKLRRLRPAAVAACFQLELPEDEIQLVVSGTAIPLVDPSKEQAAENGNIAQGAVSTGSHNGTGDGDDDIFTLDEEQLVRSHQSSEAEDKSQLTTTVPTAVSLTTLNHIAGVKVTRRVCALRLLFVRETTAVRELGGLSGFLHTFTCEVLAIARAYTAALGGNALTSFYIRQLMLQDNAHKNQGQCLMSVGGDIVHITY